MQFRSVVLHGINFVCWIPEERRNLGGCFVHLVSSPFTFYGIYYLIKPVA